MSTATKKAFFLSLAATYINFHFWFKPFPSLQKMAVYGLLCFYIFLRHKRILYWCRRSRRQAVYFLAAGCIWAVLLVVSVVVPILYGTNDFSFLSKKIFPMAIRVIEQLSILLLIDRHTQPRESLLEKYIVVTASSGAIYVSSTIFMLLFPSFRIWWASLIYQDSTVRSNISLHSTRFGLKGFTGYGQTLYCSMFFILLLYLMSKKMLRGQRIPRHLFVLSAFLLLGNIFYGRTGVVISMLAMLLVLLFWLFRYGKLPLVLSVILVVALLVGGIYLGKDSIPVLDNMYEWSIHSVVKFLSTGEEGTGSISTLERMHFSVPWETLWVGDGWYTDPGTGAYYRSTDVGYLREILFYGVFNLFLAYLGFTLECIGMAKGVNLSNRFLGTYFSFIIFVSIAICEYKGETYSNFVGILLAIWLASIRDYNMLVKPSVQTVPNLRQVRYE